MSTDLSMLLVKFAADPIQPAAANIIYPYRCSILWAERSVSPRWSR